MTQWKPKIYAGRSPFWPITLAIVLAHIMITFLIINDVADPVVGTLAVVVTFAWLYAAERHERGGLPLSWRTTPLFSGNCPRSRIPLERA
ncbi:hypothetical protein J2790_001819 [Paenarthrobacter nicotinovorans]|nr:hypothetical protein [Paenarthrobacter nicotinovorans]SCZ56873.1 hypothetical protein SAMN02799638_01994 [Arthrobacter sp. UNCCL28]